MAANPNPTRISSSMWRLWEEFLKFEPQAKLGGIYANKSGYHNYRSDLSSSDYSVGEVSNDKKGSSSYASGIDLTLNDKDMVLYSKRLDAAMRNRDKRLFINGEPVLREFIGTLNNKDVYCYMLTGGIPQGVGSDSGVDYGRDDSHLWHIHISFIRKFSDTWQAMSGVLSILKNEPYSEWEFNVATQFNADDKTELRAAVDQASALSNFSDGKGGLYSKVGNAVLSAGIPQNDNPLDGTTNPRVPMWVVLKDIIVELRELATMLATVNGDLAYIKSSLDMLTDEPVDNSHPIVAGVKYYHDNNPA